LAFFFGKCCRVLNANRNDVVVTETSTITIPADLLPADGRFCCGPSKVRSEQIDAVVAASTTIMGTSP
jgi:hypothetical protein